MNESEGIISYMLIRLFACAVFAVIILAPTPKQPIYFVNDRVCIDSVREIVRNQVLPDKEWVFYTKYGPIWTKSPFFNKGDSVDVKIYKTKK